MKSYESAEVTAHEARVYVALLSVKDWHTSSDLAFIADVAPRTARHHLLRFLRLGVVDMAEVFPAHRYRISEFAKRRSPHYVRRLDAAVEVFGLNAGRA